MAVDASRLKKLGRRGLGMPPTDGSPGIEDDATSDGQLTGVTAAASDTEQHFSPLPAVQLKPGRPETDDARPELVDHNDAEVPAAMLRRGLTPGRRPAADATAQQRQRVPRPEIEPRVPFTTRIAASTKERLEDACYHLRTKHQDFINEAITAHLEKHGF
jgi:hypothetical protein